MYLELQTAQTPDMPKLENKYYSDFYLYIFIPISGHSKERNDKIVIISRHFQAFNILNKYIKAR